MAKKKAYTISTAKKRLSTAIETASDPLSIVVRRSFIDKFTMCDVACKAVLEAHAKAKGIFMSGKYIDLNMKTIPSAMSYFALAIPLHVLNGVFGGAGPYKKRGSKSAKKLRDGIVHAMNKEDVHEVLLRSTDLNNLMDSFLSYFV